jgi:hypothetical protein
VESAVPILPSRDVDETLAFYLRLGFENTGGPHKEWNCLITSRAGAPSCTSGATRASTRPPVDTDHGIGEFALIDPSGNLVPVGSRKT